MVEILGTDDFEEWFLALEDKDAESVARVVGILEVKGTTLKFPYCSDIRGSKIALRELRVQSRGKPLRIFYAFDPIRQAVLLIGGDKSNDSRFYETVIPKAERLWQEYLTELEEL